MQKRASWIFTAFAFDVNIPPEQIVLCTISKYIALTILISTQTEMVGTKRSAIHHSIAQVAPPTHTRYDVFAYSTRFDICCMIRPVNGCSSANIKPKSQQVPRRAAPHDHDVMDAPNLHAPNSITHVQVHHQCTLCTRLIDVFIFGSWLEFWTGIFLGDTNSWCISSFFQTQHLKLSLDADFNGIYIPTRLMRIREYAMIEYITAETKSGVIAFAVS